MSVEYGTPLTSCFFVLIGILAQYLPWMLVPRGTYIYHYFASTPFLYLSIALFVHYLYLRNKTVGRVFAGVFLYLALTWFIVMFPYASGLPVSMNWLELGKKFAKVWY